MVEKNEETPRRRTRIFGVRRRAAERGTNGSTGNGGARTASEMADGSVPTNAAPTDAMPTHAAPTDAVAARPADAAGVDAPLTPSARASAAGAGADDVAEGEQTGTPAQTPQAGATIDAAEAAEAAEAPESREEEAGAEADAEASDDEAARPVATSTTSLIFHAPKIAAPLPALRRDDIDDEPSSAARGRRRRRGADADHDEEPSSTVVRVRQARKPQELITEPQRIKGSTRLEAKKQRRRDGRDAGRRRAVITEAEFLARRESVDRVMVVRSKHGRIQIAVLEDDVLVEHYVARAQDASLIGNVYLGRVQNVLPSMEAAFVDIGRGRNAVLYSGEVDWEAAAANAEGDGKNQPRRIELALKPGDKVLVQVTKDPVGHKGARLTSQVSLPGRYLVYVPNGSMNGISRKLPDTERARLKKILKEVLPDNVGVIVRTAAEGATEEQLTRDVTRLTSQWADITRQVEKAQAPALLHSEPDLLVKIVRDVFNEDFTKLVIEGDDARETIDRYLRAVAPDLLERVERYEGERDSFDEYRVSEQIDKALERKVWLPSGGSLVIDRTEAMTVVDVNTGKFVGSGGNLEETVTRNNLEAAEEIVRQLRLRDIGGIIVVDFIDMVLESNRDLVLRRLVECLSRDRTKHQVAEVTSLGLVQMTRKKLGLGLIESFSEPCETCAGRGIIVHHEPVFKHRPQQESGGSGRGRRSKGGNGGGQQPAAQKANGNGTHSITEDARHALAQIAASTVAHTAEESVKAAVTDAGGAADAPSVPLEDRPAADQGSPRADSAAPQARAKNRRGRAAAPQAAAEYPPSKSHGDVLGDVVSREGEAAKSEEAPVSILDIPLPVSNAQRAKRSVDLSATEQLLESVLDALPEPKRPGQGRSSRRASSSGGAPEQIG
ncbi:Rne/Rng family ribonuclease [Klugiella sp. YN-L-19]|uniref:Ribonuclease E n=2 Tax=Ruicaihuangia caeni TaxID=3042517 RepID=A0AAW6T3C6_9MICO|nr:Rne/Rng family ribonuclease [Klugiella sp. YN-L-19]MDI2097824.1 Rne/Rng family ribonuclease [Klugiella sp. YN-L-19]